jgi:DNA polymerase-1
MHDEIVCSTDAAHDVRKIMEQPPERLIQIAGRVPVLRTDKADLGERWAAP